MLSLFKRKTIEIFVRHCNHSTISHLKKRHKGFSKELCYENLLNTTRGRKVHITNILDTFYGTKQDHFLFQKKQPIIEIKVGKEALSFLMLLDYIESLKPHPETIVYILEDDYLHRDGWVEAMEEAFDKLPIDYLTLYDHKDKYFFPMYQNLHSKLYLTKRSHWRTTPSTTNTFAMKYKTFLRDIEAHRKYSINQDVSKDHAKFCELTNGGKLLISPIPGFSTHCEPEFESPCINWEKSLSLLSQKSGSYDHTTDNFNK